MNNVIPHTRGDTFEWFVHLTDPADDSPIDITDWTLSSKARKQDTAETLVQTFTVTVLSAPEGRYVLTASPEDANLWPLDEVLHADVEYVTNTGRKFSSPPFRIVTSKDYTF